MHDHSPSLGSGGIISLWEEREGKSNERRERKGMRGRGRKLRTRDGEGGRKERRERKGTREGGGGRGGERNERRKGKRREDISQPHRVRKANLASDRIS